MYALEYLYLYVYYRSKLFPCTVATANEGIKHDKKLLNTDQTCPEIDEVRGTE